MFIYEKDKKLSINIKNGDNLPKEVPDVQVWEDVFGVHSKIGGVVYGDFPNITKIDDYLYSIEIDDVDEEYVYKNIDKLHNTQGACTSLRKGNLFGRNYDWYYNNQISWLVKTTAKMGRFKSVGLATTLVTKKDVENKQYSELFKFIPFHILDGINENGVVCSVNVVSNDFGDTTGTNPSKPDLYTAFICRYVLDNALSAIHAVQLLKDRNIKSAVADGKHIEIHVLISDKTSNYIIEFKNNKMIVLSDQDDGYGDIPNNNVVMTNFHLSDITTNSDGKVYTPANVPAHMPSIENKIAIHGNGLERYNLAINSYNNLTTVAKMGNLLKSLYYTKAYSTAEVVSNPYWYSEFAGDPKGDGTILTIDSNASDFTEIVNVLGNAYTNRDREKDYYGIKTWQTVHSSIYDIENKKLYLKTQEHDTEYEFELN